MIQTLEWTDKGVRFIDQTKLPTEEVYVTCKTHEQVADVIRNMVVRGAPAIGVAAAMGIALGINNSKAETNGDLKRDLDQICDLMGKTRPTAVNLAWAVDRVVAANDPLQEARRIHDECDSGVVGDSCLRHGPGESPDSVRQRRRFEVDRWSSSGRPPARRPLARRSRRHEIAARPAADT